MYQVKIFASYDNPRHMQNDVNEWLENDEVELVDVKYQNWCANGPGALEGQDIFSAMIIFKER